MQSKCKKITNSENINATNCTDRLSELPDEVIVHILSFLPNVDVVRTMLLRRFRNVWTFVPTLRFDLHAYTYGMIRLDLCSKCSDHKGPTIDTFRISINKFDDDLFVQDVIDDVQMWVIFAIDKGVKNLDFGISSYDDILPRCVYTSQSLVTLSLSEVKLEDQTQVHLGSLRKLSLYCVHGSDQAFERLISGCPSLLKLIIDKPKKSEY
ncbi:hypothetical protein RND81_07G131900 [Saponaria officinalis]|uniref:F-box domain-containing protein n=1 Tax=Saponaria officinalis TaxID=3572 RepID=A0AAW1JRS3_SAPOF